ncbi:nucleoside hydrolase [Limisphaera sp. VF-2]|jgi:inosine-uridine nucleoside N-ribohydrolase|uniref:nucleoside hydrolase n=1 Tax=Limisphaera sp. VF-2 TaxID=3400418 RepID=UPI00309BC4A5
MRPPLFGFSLWVGFCSCSLLMMAGQCSRAAESGAPAGGAKPTPVILDTDIGDDIDDTWALGLLLQCPELDVKLVLTDYGRPMYRGRLAAKLLQAMGRPEIPIGLGVEVPHVGGLESQAPWLGSYDLKEYPGPIHTNGVQALIDCIRASPEPVTVIAIGPLPNLAAALDREPGIAPRARFIGMHGSVRKGYGGKPAPDAEWNVRCDPRAAQKVFAAPWREILLTPLDTCGLVSLAGEDFARVRDSRQPIPRTILENYRIWAAQRRELAPANVDERSSTLFDCVAVYLAVSEAFCEIETLGLRVTEDGFTRIDTAGRPIRVAADWKDLPAFRQWMVQRLTRP